MHNPQHCCELGPSRAPGLVRLAQPQGRRKPFERSDGARARPGRDPRRRGLF